MIVEVLGIFPHNKGALLMLEAIGARLKAEFPDVALAVPAGTSREFRERYGLLEVMRPGRKEKLARFLPLSLLRSRGKVDRSRVSVVLDASGFGYGDYWGLPKLRDRLVGTLKAWKRPGRVAILMPQALGPFEDAGMAEQFRQALDLSDLAFVRDRASMRHVEAVSPGHPAVHAAPDFTNLLHPPLPEHLRHLAGWSFVVPNEKMVAKATPEERAAYIRFMAQAVAAIAGSGRTVAILVHESSRDRAIAEEINAGLAHPVEIVEEPSTLGTKAIIAAADLIVSSRFHALVSALSNAVPALACGWSHKYAELMEDYGAGALCLELGREESWETALQTLLDSADSPDFRAHLAEAAATQRAASEAMWQQAISTIRAGGRA